MLPKYLRAVRNSLGDWVRKYLVQLGEVYSQLPSPIHLSSNHFNYYLL